MSPEEYFNHYFPSSHWSCRMILPFHLELVFILEIKMVCRPEDWNENNHFALKIPEQYRKELINMLTFGFSIKESYDLLKETYKFL